MDATTLYVTYYDRELTWLQKRVCNADDAEDILAAAFMRVCAHFQRLPDDQIRQPGSWLRTIVYRGLIDYWRYWSRRPAMCGNETDKAFDEWLDDMMVLVDDGFLVRWFNRIDATDKLEYMLTHSALPDRERTTLYLRVNGYSYPDIAETVGLTSAAAARSIYHRARWAMADAAMPTSPSVYLTEIPAVATSCL